MVNDHTAQQVDLDQALSAGDSTMILDAVEQTQSSQHKDQKLHAIVVIVSGIHATAWAVTARTLYKVTTMAARFAAVLRYTRANVKILPVYADIAVTHKRNGHQYVVQRSKVARQMRKDLLEDIEQRMLKAQADDEASGHQDVVCVHDSNQAKLARMFMIKPDDFGTVDIKEPNWDSPLNASWSLVNGWWHYVPRGQDGKVAPILTASLHPMTPIWWNNAQKPDEDKAVAHDRQYGLLIRLVTQYAIESAETPDILDAIHTIRTLPPLNKRDDVDIANLAVCIKKLSRTMGVDWIAELMPCLASRHANLVATAQLGHLFEKERWPSALISITYQSAAARFPSLAGQKELQMRVQ